MSCVVWDDDMAHVGTYDWDGYFHPYAVDPALLAGLTFCSDTDGSEDDWVDQAFLPIAPAKANGATWPVSRPTPIKK